MTSVANNFNYFPQNQLTKFSQCSLNNKDKEKRRKKLESGDTTDLRTWFYCVVLFVCFFWGEGVHVKGFCSPLCPCSSFFIIHFVNAFVLA